MSVDVILTPAGIPSRIADRAGPWDSPAVNQRNMNPFFHVYWADSEFKHKTIVAIDMCGPNASRSLKLFLETKI
jgi:hypothetical protein